MARGERRLFHLCSLMMGMMNANVIRVWGVAGAALFVMTAACAPPPPQRRAANTGEGVSIVQVGREGLEGDNLRALSSGGAHTCVIRYGGTVWCWGANGYGQLGDGTTEDRSAPAQVPALSGVVQLATGERHTCARGKLGEIVCWGSNSHGQLGVGDGRKVALGPTVVQGAGDAREVVAGARHTCVRQESRGVLCWGDNTVGQLGDGSSRLRHRPDAGDPSQRVLNIKDAVELAAGRDTTCARLRSGRVMCWGDNSAGALGFAERPILEAPVEVPSLSNATSLTGGFQHACALRRGGSPLCWGDNSAGQLAPSEPSGAHVAEVRGYHFDDALQLAVGLHHSCMILEDRQALCWGDNRYGQLGIQRATRQDPKKLRNVRDLTRVQALEAGELHTCALGAQGEVWCWGNNDRGQVGIGNAGFRQVPERVAELSDAVDLVAGEQHTCALRRSGEVVCWGSNQEGRAGSRRAEDVPAPRTVEGLRDVTALVAGQAHTCALTRKGLVYCWGSSVRGQLGAAGPGTWEPALIQGLSEVSALQAGAEHTCALTRSGAVRCWGDDAFTQTGALASGDLRAPELPPRAKPPTRLFAAGRTSCVALPPARRGPETLHCWGDNPLPDDPSPLLDPASPVEALASIQTLTIGPQWACATFGGAPRCWRADGADPERSAPAPLPGLPAVTSLAVGEQHVCATTPDKRVLCWGSNRYGQLGDGSLDDRAAPTLVPTLTDAAQVVTGATHTCARLSSGAVACWGQGARGQLGDGHLSFEPAPRRVEGLGK